MKSIATLLIVLVLGGLYPTPSMAGDPLVVTEYNPPYNYTSGGEPVGIATDIFLLMAYRAGLTVQREDIRIWPWARAYSEARKHHNVVIFTIAKSDARKNLFQWIGPFMTMDSVMLAHKDVVPTIRDMDGILKGNKVGTVRDSITEQYLIEHGADPEKLQRVCDLKLNIRKLTTGRIDVLASNLSGICDTMREMGVDPRNYRIIRHLFTTPLYIAVGRDMHAMKVDRLQRAFHSLEQDGTVGRIVLHYQKKSPGEPELYLH